ncbi:MAG: Gfo/Idh/MocA family oxidoreductase [Pseudomonadales bacterium]|nr:Gfo/Idh/MocA family oxidoreductase [Pseudomonadales bacterium]
MTNNNIRWGVIGCGAVTEAKSTPAYQKVKGFQVHAVMGRDKDRLEKYANKHNIPLRLSSAEQLIQSVDAVYIATPPDSHVQYGYMVLDAGKPCCIEKPLAISFDQAQSLVNAYEQRSVPLFVAYYRRSLPRFQQIKSWVDQGVIGSIRQISWNFCKPANELDINRQINWRTDPNIALGGYFDDLASHGLDLFNFLLGDIYHASGMCVNQQNLYGAKDAVAAIWQHPNDVLGSGYWNFGAYTRQDEVEILGERGKICFSVFLEAPVRLVTRSGEEQLTIKNPENIQLHHVENMRDTLFYAQPHVSTGKSALHTNWVMDKILDR